MQEFVSAPLSQLRELFDCIDVLQKEILVNAVLSNNTKKRINQAITAKKVLSASIKEG